MKRVNLKCPYCGSRALLRPASVVYGARAADPAAPFYVCAHYPACDAYVAAHRATRLPMGLPEAEAHIGKFSTFRCEQVIQLCGSFFPTASRAA